jgi:hypothetical protein
LCRGHVCTADMFAKGVGGYDHGPSVFTALEIVERTQNESLKPYSHRSFGRCSLPIFDRQLISAWPWVTAYRWWGNARYSRNHNRIKPKVVSFSISIRSFSSSHTFVSVTLSTFVYSLFSLLQQQSLLPGQNEGLCSCHRCRRPSGDRPLLLRHQHYRH